MPLLLASPFDRTLDPVPAEPIPPEPVPEPALAPLPPDVVRKIGPRQDLADLWFILVKAGAWLGAIYLMVLGLPLMVLLALAGAISTSCFFNSATWLRITSPPTRSAARRSTAVWC